MKGKLIVGAAVAAAAWLGYKRLQADKAEQDLWAEATDPVTPPTAAKPTSSD